MHNSMLVQRLAELHGSSVASTHKLGVDLDWVEATAFAWFAKNTLAKQTSNLPKVTGAKRTAVLGGIYYAWLYAARDMKSPFALRGKNYILPPKNTP